LGGRGRGGGNPIKSEKRERGRKPNKVVREEGEGGQVREELGR
jgi:hypothetical protein